MKTLQFHLHDELAEKLNSYLFKSGLSMNAYITQVLSSYLVDKGEITQDAAKQFCNSSPARVYVRLPKKMIEQTNTLLNNTNQNISDYVTKLITNDLPRLKQDGFVATNYYTDDCVKKVIFIPRKIGELDILFLNRAQQSAYVFFLIQNDLEQRQLFSNKKSENKQDDTLDFSSKNLEMTM